MCLNLEQHSLKKTIVFVEISKYICKQILMYLPQLLYVFAQIVKFIHTNCETYLSKFENQFVLKYFFAKYEKSLNLSAMCCLLQDTQASNNRHQGDTLSWQNCTIQMQEGADWVEEFAKVDAVYNLQIAVLFGQVYVSTLQNIFVQFAECICKNCKMYLSKLMNIFVQITITIQGNFMSCK